MIEYKMTLEQEIKSQPFLTFLFNKKRVVGGAICALLAIICFILGATVSVTFVIPTVIFALLSLNLFLFWIRRSRVRSQRMASLYRSQETKVLTYTLSENEGVIIDYCNELKTRTEQKRSKISRVLTIKDTLYVIYYSGDISVYPNTEETRKFFKG